MKSIQRIIVLSLVGSFIYYALTLAIGHEICPLRFESSKKNFPKVSYIDNANKLLAIPAFARKYDTSCQTCHTAFPNLNAFGRAFKNNGMRWPGEGYDPDFKINDTPISLGADAQKQAFPQAVWPGTIPGKIPLSVVGAFQYTSLPEADSTNLKNQFDGFASSLTILSSSTLGKLFSFWTEVGFELGFNKETGEAETDISIDRLYGIFRPFKKPVLLFKFGSFEPGLMAVSEHRSLLGGYYAINDKTVADNGFTLEPSQQGIEISGIPLNNGRFRYVVSVVEGNGNELNNKKDFYGRLEYKIGGLRLDGLSEGSKMSTKPWCDNAITFGVFGYLGFAKVTDATDSTSATLKQDDRFYLVGTDIDISVLNFLINAGYVRQNNNSPILATPSMAVNTDTFFGEVNYVAFPWWLPGVKYEYFNSGSLALDQRLTLGSTFLIRANIKAFLRGSFERVSGGGFFDNPELSAGAAMAF